MRSRLLKILAVAAFGMTTLPFVLTNDVLSFKNISPLRITAYYAAFLLIFAFGYALGKLSAAHRKLLIPCRIVGIFTFFSSMALLPLGGGIGAIAACGASAVLWFFLGERAVRRHYADFFPMFAFGVYIAVTLLSYLFYGAMAPEELCEAVQSAVVAAFIVELCLAALLVNQSGIYDKANRRRETKAVLPKGLSGYNAALVLIITLAGLGLYLFSDKIVWLLRELMRLIVLFILQLMRGSSEFMAIDQGEQGTAELGFENSAESWTPLLFLLLIVLVILLRKHIWRALKSLVKRLYGFFSRDGETGGDEPDFIDYLERAEPRKAARKEEISDSSLIRRYRAEASPITKFRIGYRLLLRQLNRSGAGIVPPDTPAVQLSKGRQVCGESLAEVVKSYEKARYNGERPESFSELESLLAIRKD